MSNTTDRQGYFLDLALYCDMQLRRNSCLNQPMETDFAPPPVSSQTNGHSGFVFVQAEVLLKASSSLFSMHAAA
ncbi:hypothetical protein DY000_02046791 [Brassica cretica]|uniref:Uncharacterized protein n=1 Tax=Brassica cretica TaxID=69181 RepID=A0ABQ7ET00_BRACR|nr:hypothetical protein DY000_02046791 [Brassica cretica]